MGSKKRGAKEIDHAWVIEQYNKGRSTRDIARQLDAYPMTINRILKKNGIQTRDLSASLKKYFEQHEHVMKGQKMSREEREKRAAGMKRHWDSLGEEQREQVVSRLVNMTQERWNSLSEAQQHDLIYKMHLGSREASIHGSKFQNEVCKQLVRRGYKAKQRTTRHTPGSQLEIDIAIEEHTTAIEIDGKSHFVDIFGQEKLEQKILKDQQKDDILMSRGWRVIRVRDNSKSFTRYSVISVADRVEAILNGKFKVEVIYLYVREEEED